MRRKNSEFRLQTIRTAFQSLWHQRAAANSKEPRKLSVIGLTEENRLFVDRMMDDLRKEFL